MSRRTIKKKMFVSQSGKLIVGDPGSTNKEEIIKNKSPCLIKNAAKGTWSVIQTMKDRRVAQLQVHHSSHDSNDKKKYKDLGMIGIDSGTVMVIDYDNFPDKTYNEDDDDPIDTSEKFYEREVVSNMANKNLLLLPHGALSATGYGDGMYKVYALFKNRKVVSVFIRFID